MAKRPERRVELRNECLRMDFDPRTSDTMYNYIWVKRPDTGQWERLHNFGVDVVAFESQTGQEINTIGMDQPIKRSPGALEVVYPNPLIQYRQFDDKIGSAKTVRKYPDFKLNELPSLNHAEGSLSFRYEIDPERPSFIVSGKLLSGRMTTAVYILDALWTDNRALPTHECAEGFPEFYIHGPEGRYCKRFDVQNVAYVLFYRADGNGVPFALIPQKPDKAGVCNYWDNWKCDIDFHTCSMNQRYVPERPSIEDSNDVGYIVTPNDDNTLNGVRVAFFPELAYAHGGFGTELRDRLAAAVRRDYFDAAKSWDRNGKWLIPSLTTFGSVPHVSEA